MMWIGYWHAGFAAGAAFVTWDRRAAVRDRSMKTLVVMLKECACLGKELRSVGASNVLRSCGRDELRSTTEKESADE